MNGVHDMGGMHGLGPVVPEADEPVFHERWEARAFALALAIGAWRRWTGDAGRFARESIPGPEYLAMSYYERWIAGAETMMLSHGLVTAEELASGQPATGVARATPPLTAARVAEAFAGRRGAARSVDAAPRLAVGDMVRARNINPTGHTRLPRYARGHVGEVTRHYGAHVFPDANARGEGEQPQHLYQVRFAARELWGEDAAFRGAVFLDLWEPYLARA